MLSKISSILIPIAGKLNNNRYLNVLRNAFMLSFPLTIFGSIFVVVANLPFLNSFMGPDTISSFQSALSIASNSSIGIMTLFVVFGIGYYLTKSYEVESVFGGAISLVSFFLLTPFVISSQNGELIGGGIPVESLGAKGMFLGMISAFISTTIFVYLTKKNMVIKMPESVPPAVSKSFEALIPAFLTLTIFMLVSIFITYVFNTDLHKIIYNAIQAPLVGLGSGILPTMIAIFFIQILWAFGLHGQIVINSIMDPIWNTLQFENFEAYIAGEKVPHVISKGFMEIYTVGMGGTGMTLSVVLAMVFFMRSKQLKQVGKVALGPGIFNVNEPVIFGLPIVMNPMVLLPWIISPMIVTLFTWGVMYMGIVPAPTGITVPWTVPVFFNGIMATNSVRGGILQLVNMLIVFMIWLPFLKALDNMNLSKEGQQS